MLRKNNSTFIIILSCFITFSYCFPANKQYEEDEVKLVEARNFNELTKQINSVVNNTKENVLIVLDLDNVLIVNFILNCAIEIIRDYNIRNENDGYSIEDLVTISMIEKWRIGRLLDECMSTYIKELQKRPNVKVICLTDSVFGDFYVVKSRENNRIAELKDKGIDFSKSFPKYGNHVLYTDHSKWSYCDVKTHHLSTNTHAFPFLIKKFKGTKHKNNIPFNSPKEMFKNSFLYKNGILFSRHHSKQNVLKFFLKDLEKKVNWKPSHVVFIDDKPENLFTFLDPMVMNLQIGSERNPQYKLIYYTKIYSLRKQIKEGYVSPNKEIYNKKTIILRTLNTIKLAKEKLNKS